MRDSAISENMKRQTSYHPPAGKPGWASPAGGTLDLLYLAWGLRKYEETPQEISTRDGWLYFTARKGTPSLELAGGPPGRIKLQPQEFIILHPDCACGWSDEKKASAEICTWVWRSPSRWSALQPPQAGFLRLRPAGPHLAKLHELHQQTRREIQHSDENTKLALEALRLEVDLSLARSLAPSGPPPSDSQRLALACRWIEEHLADHSPVTGLCDYLQLSAATLNRLFQRGLGQSVRSFAKECRLKKANQLIGDQKVSLKEAAYRLGYRFPNDLSRARTAGSKRSG